MTTHAHPLLAHLHRLAAPAAPDAILLKRWIEQRDEAAFAALMARHGPMVLGVCRRLLGDGQDAEDAFQATFLVLSRQASRLRQPEALAGFLHTIARRLARKARVTMRRRQRNQTDADAPEPVDPQPHVLDVLSGRELLALIDAEIGRLPEVYRLPLLLCLLQGRTVEEAARQLGWTIGSLRGRLERGREQLRQRLTRRGIGLSVGALALPAPAVVPEKLLAESVRHLSGTVPAAISVLAAGSASAIKKVACVLFMLVAATGVSLLTVATPRPSPPATPAAPSVQAKDAPRRDRYGDPLPEGAVARLGSLRFRAPGEIVALAFAPDGKTLAVSAHGGLFLMDAAGGKRIERFPIVTNSGDGSWATENSILFSPDGKLLLGRGHKAVKQSLLPVVRVWDAAGERKPREYDLGPSIIWVGWSADSQPLAIRVADDGALHLHELSASRSRRFACAKPYKHPLNSIVVDPPIACSPSGHVLAFPDAENIIHVWDTVTGRERCALLPKGERIDFLTFSPDGSRLVTRTSKAVQMWETAKGKSVYTVDADTNYNSSRPVFTADGKTLVILDSSRTIFETLRSIRFWDAATGKERGRTQDKDDFAPSFAVSADGKWLATAGRYGVGIDLWDVVTGKKKAGPVGHSHRPNGIAFSPDGRRVATGATTEGVIQFWDRATGEPLMRIHRPDRWVRDIALSLDGRSLFSTWTDENVWITDAAGGERRHVLKLDDPDRPATRQSATSMRLSDDGDRLVVFSLYYEKENDGLSNEDTLITGWDTSTRKQLFRRRRSGMEAWPIVSADARVLALPQTEDSRSPGHAAGMGPIQLEEAMTGERLLSFPALKGQTLPLEFSPDGRLLALRNSYDAKPSQNGKASKEINTVRLWEILTATEVLSLPAADLIHVAFSPDNRLLAVAAPQREIVVWDLALGRELRRFKGFDAKMIYWLSFSPDSRQLVSCFPDSTLLIWEINTAPPCKLDAADAAKAWADLAGTDAPRAFRARGALAFAPEEAIPLLTKHLHPAAVADPQRLRRLLADLESDQFAVREKAQEELAKLGDLAEPSLRKTLENKPTLEVRKRVQAVLERLRGPVTKPELLQSLRAVGVLEDIGTSEARRLLESLSQGAAEARQTREAKASLRRLDLRRRSRR